MIRLLLNFLSTWICLHITFISPAQTEPVANYIRGYFRNPLNVPISLSGNFGELRPNHYHMGIDIRTLQRENLPVFAAADGYIAKIKIEPAGFGRAIYINHPNGYTTLYAHLNDFFPELDAYVKQQQYQQECWNIFLEDIPPDLFPVTKGDFIAYSGNTGGSQAPHLHFEIRRTIDDVNVNPLLFGFPLPDNTKPAIIRLALYDRTRSTYEQYPKMVPLKKTGSDFTTVPSLIKTSSPKISFAISAFDTHTGSANQNGIYEAWLYDHDTLITGFRMDNISYDDTRYLNAHIDYKTRSGGGPLLQHVSQLPGYINSIYFPMKGDGVIDISDGTIHEMKIVVKDTYGNTSALNYSVQYNGPAPVTQQPEGKLFYPGSIDGYEAEDCEFFIDENCLYDSVHIKYSRIFSASLTVFSPVHNIGALHIPLQDSFVVRIKPAASVSLKKEHIVMQRTGGSGKSVQKVEWHHDWATARFRDFGSFQLLLDEEPPLITPFGIVNGANLSKATRIAFTVSDNYGRYKNFRAELDGKWLRFTNDKGRTYIYRFDDMCPPGRHELKITVEDEAGNRATRLYEFER